VGPEDPWRPTQALTAVTASVPREPILDSDAERLTHEVPCVTRATSNRPACHGPSSPSRLLISRECQVFFPEVVRRIDKRSAPGFTPGADRSPG